MAVAMANIKSDPESSSSSSPSSSSSDSSFTTPEIKSEYPSTHHTHNSNHSDLSHSNSGSDHSMESTATIRASNGDMALNGALKADSEPSLGAVGVLFKQLNNDLNDMIAGIQAQMQKKFVLPHLTDLVKDPHQTGAQMTSVSSEILHNRAHIAELCLQQAGNLQVQMDGMWSLLECQQEAQKQLEEELKKSQKKCQDLERKTMVPSSTAGDFLSLHRIVNRLLKGEAKEDVLDGVSQHLHAWVRALDTDQMHAALLHARNGTEASHLKRSADEDWDGDGSSDEDDEEQLQVDDTNGEEEYTPTRPKRQRSGELPPPTTSSSTSTTTTTPATGAGNEVWASEVLFSLSQPDPKSDITQAQLEMMIVEESWRRRYPEASFNMNASNSRPGKEGRGKKKRGKLPEVATSILKKWLFDHYIHPYPTEEEKGALATKTNLSLNQINNWFTNARRRILPKSKGQSSPMTGPGSPLAEEHASMRPPATRASAMLSSTRMRSVEPATTKSMPSQFQSKNTPSSLHTESAIMDDDEDEDDDEDDN
eukprot:TRINITY_DN4032_c1_g1_i1.p1 TRINITY_DN4032_c1_g1~~TRINITY_DN4032_c1_g1_i1.p1  ORF type:complete len:537 (+),score=122.03 TRINITY_DN4032_c1_g1_i1:245-1855(+)